MHQRQKRFVSTTCLRSRLRLRLRLRRRLWLLSFERDLDRRLDLLSFLSLSRWRSRLRLRLRRFSFLSLSLLSLFFLSLLSLSSSFLLEQRAAACQYICIRGPIGKEKYDTIEWLQKHKICIRAPAQDDDEARKQRSRLEHTAAFTERLQETNHRARD